MKVGVIGAGVSGLAAARDLTRTGHQAVVFEKSRGFGGRCATRRKDGFTWDTGATSIAPRGKRIEDVMLHELDPSELVRIDAPIYTHSNLRVSPGDPRKNVDRYVYRSGINKFAKLLGDGLDIRFETTIDSLTREGDRYRVGDEVFDGLILTPPVPQTSLLLWSLGESRPIAGVRYRSSLSILLGYDVPTPTVPYFAVIEVDQRHPMIWLSIESIKCEGRAPQGGCAIVVQMAPAFSHDYYERGNDWLVQVATEFVAHLYGPTFATPVVSDVMRWKYASPESITSFENANSDASRLVITGDGFFGGRIEDAFESGVRASEFLRATE